MEKTNKNRLYETRENEHGDVREEMSEEVEWTKSQKAENELAIGKVLSKKRTCCVFATEGKFMWIKNSKEKSGIEWIQKNMVRPKLHKLL